MSNVLGNNINEKCPLLNKIFMELCKGAATFD